MRLRLPDPDRSRAILVGVGSYHHQPGLEGAHEGARALRKVLTDPRLGSMKPEHCVLLPEDVSVDQLGSALAHAAAQAQDLLLFYFAGHGVHPETRRDDLHLALSGTRDEDMGFSGVRFDAVRDMVLDSTAAAKVVLLDCCYSGSAIGRGMSSTMRILDEVDIDGTAVLTSSPRNRRSRILPGETYPAYTTRLLKVIRQGVPGGDQLLTLRTLHDELRRSLKSSGLDEPQARSHMSLDGLGLVRNVAWTGKAGVDGKPAAQPDTPARPVQSVRSEPVVPNEQAPWEDLARRARSDRPADRASAYHDAILRLAGDAAAGRITPGDLVPSAASGPVVTSAAKPRPPFDLPLGKPSFYYYLALGGALSLMFIAILHDLGGEQISKAVTNGFGESAGYILAGIALFAGTGILVVGTGLGIVRPKPTPLTFGCGFLSATAAALTLGVHVWPIALSVVTIGASLALASLLSRHPS
ncbi:hypothetical protein C8258_21090 [Nocardia sp. MDA0666]|uniref:caspase family protein n=1 Tax=Nocardia sp. MDA0666 TaxID=2135448 RepID=UPI000D11F251|nr:caspase family protein [Nocardia sp. MDA0666]PSR65751.1 hypothetical protein C8258_21090 [Nocardia sp. MDA0666]